MPTPDPTARVPPAASSSPAGCACVWLFAMGWLALAAPTVLAWARFSLASSLHSYTLLVPAISLYLLWDQRAATRPRMPVGWSRAVLCVAGGILLVWGIAAWQPAMPLDRWRLAAMIGALIAGLALVWGGAAWRSRLFPLLFLLAMIPLSPEAEHQFSQFLQRYSGWLAYHFIRWTGTPIYREGPFLVLPDLTMEVAEECSGIRSTLVLLVTSAVAAHLFLRGTAARVALVALVIPLGIARNAFRILVIGWLTAHVDPQIIYGPLHRRGGPLFFILSLAVLLAWLLLLRRWDRGNIKPQTKGAIREST